MKYFYRSKTQNLVPKLFPMVLHIIITKPIQAASANFFPVNGIGLSKVSLVLLHIHCQTMSGVFLKREAHVVSYLVIGSM